MHIFYDTANRLSIDECQKIVDALQLESTKSVIAAQKFPDGFFDLVFIEGDHRYEGAKNDINAWKSKVRPGGILCSHDREDYPINFTLAHRDGKVETMDVHGDVILVLAECFGNDFDRGEISPGQ